MKKRTCVWLAVLALSTLLGIADPAGAVPNQGDQSVGGSPPFQPVRNPSSPYGAVSMRCEEWAPYGACDSRYHQWYIDNVENYWIYCYGECADDPGNLYGNAPSAGTPPAALCLGQCRGAAASTAFQYYAIFTRDLYYIPVANGTAQGNPHNIQVSAVTNFFNHGYWVARAYPDQPRDCLTPGDQVVLCRQHARSTYSAFPNPSVQVQAWVVSQDQDISMWGTWIACHVLLPNEYYPDKCGSDND